MDYEFPGAAWLAALHDKLNSDERYNQIARNWEGDLLFTIQADQGFEQTVSLYLDLWHGSCRQSRVIENGEVLDTSFKLEAPYTNWVRILNGDLHPMQAMLTQKIKVGGSMTYMMRHVPTVLDFTRCAQEITQF